MILKSFVSTHLPDELLIIQTSARNIELPELNRYEKALIYHYSDDGFQHVNERLRDSNGQDLGEFGNLLKKALKKLPHYVGLVYRNAKLNQTQIRKYEISLKNNSVIAEPTFTSCSRSKLIANEYGGNVTFRILSTTGKNIEAVAKYGLHGSPNEKEVIFVPNTEFSVLDIERKKITLK